MLRSRLFIVLALVVAAAGWWAYQTFSAQILPDGVTPKGDPPPISPVVLAYVSLGTTVVSLLTGITGLALKLVELRKKVSDT